MSWISDVKYELHKLDINQKKLRQFGIGIAVFFVIIYFLLFSQNSNIYSNILIATISGFFLFVGIFYPLKLKKFYIYWMSLALGMGWFMSRLLLAILFFIILFPIGIIGKIFKSKFLELNFKNNDKTYWKLKSHNVINYKKMY